jgi:hypothetical protein
MRTSSTIATPERKGANSPGNERDRSLNAFTAALRELETPGPQIHKVLVCIHM